MTEEFIGFPKIYRLSREIVITEKIDGTNAQIYVGEDGTVRAASRNQWLPESGDDNHGFGAWVAANKEELRALGPGRHYGEWWGQGIQRKYGLSEKRFSLFNVSRWADATVRPKCCHVVPVLATCITFDSSVVDKAIEMLKESGSFAAPGFMKPEGIVIYHVQSNTLFKKTIEKDEEWKGKNA